MNNLFSKWAIFYNGYTIAITEDNQLFDMDSKLKLVEHWNNGTVSYRIPKTSDRIGLKTILKNRVEKRILIEQFVPF